MMKLASRQKALTVLSLFGFISVIGAADAQAQDECNCEEREGIYGWEHWFDDTPVDLGFTNSHTNVEGGTCVQYHDPYFCDGMAMKILRANGGDLPSGVAVSTFLARVQALPSARASEIASFLNDYGEFAKLHPSGSHIVIEGCEGVRAVAISQELAREMSVSRAS